jgi:hypothetical protein
MLYIGYVICVKDQLPLILIWLFPKNYSFSMNLTLYCKLGPHTKYQNYVKKIQDIITPLMVATSFGVQPRRAAHTLLSDQNPLYSDLSVNRSEYYQAVGTGDTHHITFTVTAIVTGSDLDQNVFP